MLKHWFSLFSTGLVLLFTVQSCSKEPDPANGNNTNSGELTDEDFYKMASNKTGFQYYKNITDTLTAANQSPHKSFILVRFNDVALNVLGSDGKLPANRVFPEDAIIVKEIYKTKGGKLDHIAVLMKKPKDNNSESGWLWAEYTSSGKTQVSVADKGSQCISCHKGNGNRDLVLTFANH